MDSLATTLDAAEPGNVTVGDDHFPEDWVALDIGADSCQLIAELIAEADTVIWNGPAGHAEEDRFRGGTLAIARAVRDASASVLVGGGHTVSALSEVQLSREDVHVSTSGGAMLAMLMGRELHAVRALES